MESLHDIAAALGTPVTDLFSEAAGPTLSASEFRVAQLHNGEMARSGDGKAAAPLITRMAERPTTTAGSSAWCSRAS